MSINRRSLIAIYSSLPALVAGMATSLVIYGRLMAAQSSYSHIEMAIVFSVFSAVLAFGLVAFATFSAVDWFIPADASPR